MLEDEFVVGLPPEAIRKLETSPRSQQPDDLNRA